MFHPPQSDQPTRASQRLARIGDTAFRRRGRVLLGWIVALLMVGALGSGFAGEFDADHLTPDSDSAAAAELIAERFPALGTGDTVDVVWQVAGTRGAGDPVPAGVDALLDEAVGLSGIGGVGEALVAEREGIGMVPLLLDRPEPEVPQATAERLIQRAVALSEEEVQIELAGSVIADAEEVTSPEIAALVAAGVILLIAFRSAVAAGLPLFIALFGLAISASLIGALAGVAAVPEWGMAVAALIGIGVGVDYALLIISRFREARRRGLSDREANAEAIATAGWSVMLAGGTVIVALLGLFVVGIPFLNGVALAAGAAVLVVVAAAITLLPALLGYLGKHLDRLGLTRASRRPLGHGDVARRWSAAVQRRPWRAGAAALALLLALSVPALDLRLGFPDAGNDPPGSTTRAAYELVEEGFGPGHAGPLLVAVDLGSPEAAVRISELRRALVGTDGISAVQAPIVDPAGTAALLPAVPSSAPQAEETAELAKHLRGEVIPAALADSGATAHVGGLTATLIDQSSLVGERLVLFIAAVVGLGFLVLLSVLRAPVVALTAAAMNLLSVGAAYGVLAMVASGGWLGGLVGIDTPTPVPAAILVMMFAILFGLSMDYEVFLISRIREEWTRTGDASVAITEGVAGTARVITAAAAIMVAVFLGFVFSSEVFLVMTGVGMAAAIFVDATLIRMVLIPATMQILGGSSWWRPSRGDVLAPATGNASRR